MAFSANGNFLATAHVDDLGIYLWNNQSLFTQVSLRALEQDFEPKLAPLPGSTARQSEEDGEPIQTSAEEDEFSSPEQIADSLVTLSLLADSRWKNLLSLDAIKVQFLTISFTRLNCVTNFSFLNSVAISPRKRPKRKSWRHSSCPTLIALNRPAMR